MSFLENIDVPPRRTDRRLCVHCEASAATCKALVWLRGEANRCCEKKRIGDHAAEVS